MSCANHEIKVIMVEYGNNVGNYTYFNPYIRSCLKSIFIFCGIKKEQEEDVDCNLISKKGKQNKQQTSSSICWNYLLFCCPFRGLQITSQTGFPWTQFCHLSKSLLGSDFKRSFNLILKTYVMLSSYLHFSVSKKIDIMIQNLS